MAAQDLIVYYVQLGLSPNNFWYFFIDLQLCCSQSRCIQGALIETAPEAEKQG